MDAIRIAIVEDCLDDKEALYACLLRYAQEENLIFNIDCFPNGEQFLASEINYALIFMDIEMPGKNGIEVAERLRQKGIDDVIVLVTNMVQYAIHGYSVRAADYIVKPVRFEQLALKMPFYLSMIRRKKQDITIKNRYGIIKILISEIRYIEIYGHNILFHLCDRTEDCSGTLKEYEQQLSNYGFARCSQSCLVNLAHVDGVYKDEVRVGADRLGISRREKKAFLTAFTTFDGGYGV